MTPGLQRSVLPVILSTALAVATGAYAQPPVQLTLAEAQRLAVQNNPELSAARHVAAAAGQVPLEYRAAFLPSVAGALTGVGADSGSRIAAGALNNPVIYDRVGTGLIVNQLVTDFGRTRRLVDSATLRAQAQEQASESTRARILMATARAYFGGLRARSVLTVAGQTVSARQLVVDQVTALANNNLRSQLDVSFANVNLSDARLLLAQAENAVRAADADLANALGLPGQTSFVLQDEPMPGALPESVDASIAQALKDRPELKDLRLQQAAAERFARAERALFYPSVSAVGMAGVVPAREAAVPGKYSAVGVNLNVPVFSGGLFRARQTEAEIRAKAASDLVNAMGNQVTRDVRVAYLNARTALERVALTDQLLAQAQLGLNLAQGRYDLGLSAIVELSQAQLNLTAAQIAAASARYDYQAERAVFEYQTGTLR